MTITTEIHSIFDDDSIKLTIEIGGPKIEVRINDHDPIFVDGTKFFDSVHLLERVQNQAKTYKEKKK